MNLCARLVSSSPDYSPSFAEKKTTYIQEDRQLFTKRSIDKVWWRPHQTRWRKIKKHRAWLRPWLQRVFCVFFTSGISGSRSDEVQIKFPPPSSLLLIGSCKRFQVVVFVMQPWSTFGHWRLTKKTPGPTLRTCWERERERETKEFDGKGKRIIACQQCPCSY